ncbi:hypothetical protein [Corynebacterium liangguodongii]|uniref:hypothetical protein n=1 Tax=Corynebacterium liangguodongii TaxID=2079535 RepID=UPI001304C3A7|nr:hypothetical protein [Corynebacterium liangguodongii]
MSALIDLLVNLTSTVLEKLSSSVDFESLIETASSKGSSAIEGLSSKIEASSEK